MKRREFIKSSLCLIGCYGLKQLIPESIWENIIKDPEWNEIKESVNKLKTKFSLQKDQSAIIINPAKQKLYLIKNNQILKTYPVSTSKYGIGTKSESNKTPFGTHAIKEKIGANAELGSIFKYLHNTGEISKIYTKKIDILEDYITSRVMRLIGLEKGINSGKGIDSYSRHIYIHGTPEEGLIGTPASHGCIRMKNKDVVELFDLVPKNTLVEIQNKNFLST